MSVNTRPETPREYQQSVIEMSEDSINSIEKVEEWTVLSNGTTKSPKTNGQHVKNGERNNLPRFGFVPKINLAIKLLSIKIYSYQMLCIYFSRF